jgi:hypothetical protein
MDQLRCLLPEYRPYSYSWNTSPVQDTETAEGLAAATYRVTVTDANGCVAEDEVIVEQPKTISLSL